MIKLKRLLSDATYVASKDGASVTFDADTDTDAEKQAVDMQIGRPKKIDEAREVRDQKGWDMWTSATTVQNVKLGSSFSYKGHRFKVVGFRPKTKFCVIAKRDDGEELYFSPQATLDALGLKNPYSEQRQGSAPTGTARSGLGYQDDPKPTGYPIHKTMKNEADKPSLSAQLKQAKKELKDFERNYTTQPYEPDMPNTHNKFVNTELDTLYNRVWDLEKKIAGQQTKKEATPPSKPPVHPSRVTPTGGQYHVTGVQPKKETASPAWAFVQRIQKSDKRAFAAKYLSWLQGGKKGPAPARPEAWKDRAGFNDWQKIKSNLDSLTDQPVEGLKEDDFKPGQKVQHFTSPEAIATVVRFDPDKEYPAPYHKGSWKGHSFGSGGLVTVKWPDGRTEQDFAHYWKPVNESYKQLRPLRRLIREELRHVLYEDNQWQAEYRGFRISYSGGAGNGVVSVSKSQVSSETFDQELDAAHDILSKFRMTKPGSEWGTDGVGYYTNKKNGLVNVKKSGVVPKNGKAGFTALGLQVG